MFRLFYMQVLDDSWSERAHEISEKRSEVTPQEQSYTTEMDLKLSGTKPILISWLLKKIWVKTLIH